jgi:hypothetical protein
LFAAAAFLCPQQRPPPARNARVSSTRISLTVSPANVRPAPRRERLCNWLALLALLAIGIL